MSDQRQKSIVRHTCKQCFKTWRQKQSFLNHLKICKGNGSPPEYRCDQCFKTFVYERSFHNHKCKVGISEIKTCQFCNKEYISSACFDKHSKICAERKRRIISMKGGEGNNKPVAPPKYQCDKCSKTFNWRTGLRRHKCKKDDNSLIVKPCPFCEKKYRNRQGCLDRHIEVCGKRNKWLNSMGFRMENIPLADRNTSSERFGYVCVRCGCRFKRLQIDRIAFHRCTNKIMKVKRNMNRYTNSYTRVVIDKTRISRKKFKGRICHNCKKIFPSKELC